MLYPAELRAQGRRSSLRERRRRQGRSRVTASSSGPPLADDRSPAVAMSWRGYPPDTLMPYDRPGMLLALLLLTVEPTVDERIARGMAELDTLDYDAAALDLALAADDPAATPA